MSSTFRAFQTGLMAGQQQRQVRDQEAARKQAADAFGAGNYEGASTALMKGGLYDEADAYTKAADRAKSEAQTRMYADAYKMGATGDGGTKGGYTAVRDIAGQSGDMATVGTMEKSLAQMSAQERENAARTMEFSARLAFDLSNLPPEAREEAKMRAVAQFGGAFGITPDMAAQMATDDQTLSSTMNFSLDAIERIKAEQADRRQTETERHNRAMENKGGGNGIQLQFGEGGTLSGLSIGGDAPKGKSPAIVRGPDGQPVVTPGPQQEAANKSWQALQDFKAQNTIVMDDIARAKALIGPMTTGAAASLADLPIFGNSTPAGQLKNRIATIKANVGFDKLQNMRENSPTGGALGSVTEREIAFLQAVFGSLETAQTEQDLAYNLERLEQFMQGREARLQAAFAQDYPGLGDYAGFVGETSNQMRDVTKSPGGVTARNPQTGEIIRYNEQTNQWEPVQ